MHELEHNARHEALDLLLGGDDGSAGYAAAHDRLQRDALLRREFESLHALGAELVTLGDALHTAAGTVDVREDVLDSIAHLAFEQLGVARANPYGDVENGLRALKTDFDARAGHIDIVGDVMAAVAASRKSDAEVELPFAQLAMDLNALGTAANQYAPKVDLVDTVMSRVSAAKVAEPATTPFKARPAAGKPQAIRRGPGAAQRWGGWAAAAALLLGAGWLYFASSGSFVEPGDAPSVAMNSHASGESDDQPLEKLPSISGLEPGEAKPEDVTSPEGAARPRIKEAITLQDAINARRRDLLAQGQDFSALASLTGDEAVALLKSSELSLDALLGAVQFLSSDEAIEALRAAVEANPDDPRLKYALAMSLDGSPESAEERLQQLSQLASVDPENSLPHYLMAADYFERGDMTQALDALSRGAAFQQSTAYALDSARQREAAFVASGLDTDAARFLALSGAGSGEYGDVATLRNELLDYGAYYEEQGDYDTAQQIYNAVNQLGVQLYQGASLAVEQQYGLETQQEALLAIQGIAEVFQQPESVALLGETLGVLAGGIVDVTNYISARQEMVANPATSGQVDWPAFLEHVMRNGDLNISGFIR